MSSKSQDSHNTHFSPRVARRRTRTRKRVLQAAATLFAERGIDNVTLTDITDAADISRGNFYTYFDSKQELLHEIYRPVFQYAQERFQDLVQQPPAQAIEEIVRLHLDIWREFPHTLSVAHQVRYVSPESCVSVHSAHMQEAVEIFKSAAREDLLRVEPALAAKMLDTIAVPLLQLCQEAADPDELFVQSMLRLLLKG